ncbi:deaminase-reductase domain-containing protein [Micromonospora sp. ATCC 39149]|uniref:Dihydrofolate reductase n=1 Tax=Micromonospora carbonacea TaxID=47853 RepID=A0A7D5Y5I1_9ACTN|nr:dihydrofolate reductase family protein [Micromonospora sp. ATCC 39149]EEP71044.1 deaminase-reductase domain-containing protein [Micromonospora sp. ATCC 39149]QLJ97372.1 dihydrofolate reductase [Micromonospora carbonacea]
MGVSLRKLVYYVASTLDGFIAAPDGSYDFFPVEPDVTAHLAAGWPQAFPTFSHPQLGIDRPTGRFDTVLMGRATYEPALRAGIASPYAHLRQYVFSRSLPPSTAPGLEVFAGDPVAFVRELKGRPGGDIWLCGGGNLAGQLLPEVDELVVKLHPIVAGSGIPLAARGFEAHRFALTGTRAFDSGLVLLHYVAAPAPSAPAAALATPAGAAADGAAAGVTAEGAPGR